MVIVKNHCICENLIVLITIFPSEVSLEDYINSELVNDQKDLKITIIDHNYAYNMVVVFLDYDNYCYH